MGIRDRANNRQDRREDRRDNRTPAAAAAMGAAAGVAVHKKRHSKDDGSVDSNTSKGSHSSGEGGPVTYAMREKLLTFGNDFTIDKMEEGKHRGQGEPAFYVDNKIVRVRETFNIRSSRRGKVLYQVQERKMRVRDSMAVEDEDGHKIAEIKLRAVGVVRDNFVIKIRGERDWQAHGSILEHDFTIKENGRLIAKIHKRWVTPIKDRYFIDIPNSEDAALVLMVAVGLEDLSGN